MQDIVDPKTLIPTTESVTSSSYISHLYGFNRIKNTLAAHESLNLLSKINTIKKYYHSKVGYSALFLSIALTIYIMRRMRTVRKDQDHPPAECNPPGASRREIPQSDFVIMVY